MHFLTNALLFRSSSLQLCRSFSTGKVIMDAGKRAAARYAVDNFVKVSFNSIVLTFGRANETIGALYHDRYGVRNVIASVKIK